MVLVFLRVLWDLLNEFMLSSVESIQAFAQLGLWEISESHLRTRCYIFWRLNTPDSMSGKFWIFYALGHNGWRCESSGLKIIKLKSKQGSLHYWMFRNMTIGRESPKAPEPEHCGGQGHFLLQHLFLLDHQRFYLRISVHPLSFYQFIYLPCPLRAPS